MHTPLHDLHIHTNLSACSTDPMQTVESIVDYAAKHGIATVGITNHVWDREIPGASEWYAPQDFDHISRPGTAKACACASARRRSLPAASSR